ncbi:MAG: two-component sensor histidine kinase [Planctomycetes bacterium]|nr:two-component sensor histidine kinase [Planctomycetota bacterium]
MPNSELNVPQEFDWDLAAQTITLRIRWFGICIGYVFVNLLGDGERANQGVLNAILLVGAIYALFDTIYSIRGRIFLSQWPLFVSFMEAVFIGLLCYFDRGATSYFRFYYFLSLLVCAIRYAQRVTWSTLAMHSLSFTSVALVQGITTKDDLASILLTPIFMGWVTWASTSLAGLLKWAGWRLRQLYEALRENQQLLERRIAERTRQLQESQAMLLQQEKQAGFGLLAAGIAHEVGNPLASISSLVQLLNRRNIDDETRSKLLLVDDQLRRIQRTLRELVDFSRPVVYEKTQGDIHSVLDTALNIAKYYKRKKGRQIVSQYADDVPLLLIVRDQLVQVFLNLVLNALDATEEGGEITIRTTLELDNVRIDVTDNGNGISDESRSKIFQPYFTTKETGTGLGLFVCRNIVEQNAGRIEMTSSSPNGTTFTVWLPRSQDANVNDR